jgi:predicted CXXCH cytochrome family protein
MIGFRIVFATISSMRNRIPWLLAVLVVLAASGLGVRGAASAPGEGCVTALCHPKMLKAKVIHPAAESCGDCHEAAATPHPQAGRRTFKLVQEGGDLCKNCHSIDVAKKVVHDPVRKGECTSCHDPHESAEPKLLVQPKESLCSMCHSEKTNLKYMHGPAATGDCTECHVPHSSDNKAMAVTPGNDLCFRCHGAVQSVMKKKVVHAALEEGCTSCHNPHGSPNKRLLSAEGANLCFQCHSKIAERVEKSKSVHAPVKTERGCASCHNPHASDGEKLMPQGEKELCLGCHKNVLKKNQTFLHGPIREGKCTPCHDPHGAQAGKLLVKAFPADLYVSYTESEYPLCFTCHNRDLLRFPDTSFATGFRDGDRNLHFVHVNKKDKGRSCKACHGMHASELPKLIPEKVPFGKWDLPMKYIKTETGGSCAPGCHRSFHYDRKTPGKAPEPEKPKAPAKPRAK